MLFFYSAFFILYIEPTYLDVKIGTVSLALSHETQAANAIAVAPFASAGLKDVDINIEMKSGSYMKVEGNVGSLSLKDNRTNSIT